MYLGVTPHSALKSLGMEAVVAMDWFFFKFEVIEAFHKTKSTFFYQIMFLLKFIKSQPKTPVPRMKHVTTAKRGFNINRKNSMIISHITMPELGYKRLPSKVR